MNIFQVTDNNIECLKDYILSSDIKEHLNYYNLDSNIDYYEMLKDYIFSQNSIALIGMDNDLIVGFLVGKVEKDDELNCMVAKIEHSMFNDMSFYKLFINEFEKISKSKNCEYLSVCIPNFQEKLLDVINLTDFNDYKVRLEKKLI